MADKWDSQSSSLRERMPSWIGPETANPYFNSMTPPGTLLMNLRA